MIAVWNSRRVRPPRDSLAGEQLGTPVKHNYNFDARRARISAGFSSVINAVLKPTFHNGIKISFISRSCARRHCDIGGLFARDSPAAEDFYFKFLKSRLPAS